MDRLYHNPFITYRRSPDNYYSSVIQDYSTQEPPSTNLSTPFYHPNCGAMATTDYLRPSNPPSSPPLNNVTSPSRLSSPHGLAISLQSYSAPNRQSSDDRASTSIESTLLPHSNVNATSAYSAPSYSNHPEIQEERVVGRNGGIGGANGQDWKTSLHAESREGGSLESAIGEPNSFKSTKKITGLGLGYSGEDGRVPTSSLSGALAEGGVSRSGFTSNQPSSSFQQASSSSFEGSFFSPQTKSNNHSGNGGSGVGDNSDVSAGSSRGSGKRASGLPIETDSSFNSSHSSQLHQAQHSNTTPSRTGPSRVDDNQPIYVHTFFPDNGEAGIPITIIATLNSDWASKIGLQSSDQSFEHSKSRGKLMVTFGNEDVEAKVERSFNPDDGRGQTDFNVNITVAAPSFASTQWTSTRVPISINIFGMDSNPTDLTIPGDGKEVGEFLYWLVSPRSALKRFGEPLEDEGRLDKPAKQSSSALRRPASYPALAASSDPADPSNLGQSSESNSNSYGRASGGTLNRSISHNRGNGSTSSAQSFHPSMHAMRHYRSDMGMSSNSPSQQSQSSFGTGPTPSPAVGSDRISGDFTFSVGRPNSINLPQNGFAGMGISGPSGAISPGGISRPDLSMDSDSRPVTANSASMGSPSISMDDRQLSHSSSINSLNASFNSMRRGSAGYSPALPGGSTFSPSSPVPNNQSSKPKATPPSNLTKKEVPSASGSGGAAATVKAGSRAVLQTHGELQDMAVGWSHDEYMSSRRLVQFWRRQDGTTIHMTFRPILPHQYVQNSIVVSCIFREDKNECFITSVDLIYLLEALVASRFTIEEKNRIRRNLEGFKPSTVAKGKNDSSEFFKVIMNFPNPKPRNIEKDVKVFPWSVLGKALSKIIGKYSAAPPAGPSEPVQTNNNNAPTSPSDQQQHLPSLTSPFSPTPSVMAGNQPAFHPSPRSNGQYGQFSPGQPSSMNGNGNGMGMASNLGGPSSPPYNSNKNNYSHDNPYQQQAYHQSPNFKDGSSHYSGGY